MEKRSKYKVGRKIPLEVAFIKSYCAWNGKAKRKTQVYIFTKRLQRAIEEKKIRKDSVFAQHIEYIQGRLVAHYNSMPGCKVFRIPDDKLKELKAKCNIYKAGMQHLCGLSGWGQLTEDTIINDNKILPATEFRNASFNLVGFTGKWLQLVGDPSTPFKMMLWGTGGSGKSTLAIELAKYLAGTLGKRVLYIANEEGAGATLHEKMTRLNAFHPNLFITKQLPARLVEYDYVFCDSANSMQMEVSKFEQAAKLYPQLSWVLLFQTTKDGKFLGEKNWQHAVDVEVYCHEGKARALKSRFGGKDVVDIRFE